uniref:Putative open rectifier potassium channel protein 1 n=1 Tax=Phlebotomus kandelakii TaxID=1109342 RepID=A0A6B2EDJ6_9DIPT
MSPKQWLAMLAFYVSYLFFGASVFYTLEQDLETERRIQALQDRIDVNDLLVEYLAPYNRTLQHELLEKVSVYCEKPVTNYTEDKYMDPYVWTFYHSFYFVFTVISTVGYGNISPNSTFGRMFMILYAIIGLPINVITLAALGSFFGKTFSKLHNRYKQYKKSTNSHYVAMKLSMIAQVLLYLIPGMLIFIFLPACLFTYFEDWPYSVSVYYAFVTLTTIGFGDYACTFQPHQERVFGMYFIMYEVFVIFWFVFGLGYVLMIMGFLVKAYQSRRVKQLEHKLAQSLKDTQSRVWNGVTKDIGFLRKMLNELHMLNFKPVYSEGTDKFLQLNINRSESCPELTMYRPDSPSVVCRKRAMSESYPGLDEMFTTQSTTTLNRTQSDTDLAKIDRKRTFEGAKNATQTGELLAQLVTALGQYRGPEDDRQSVMDLSGGIHGFSDNEILASERTWSGWSLPTSERSISISGPSPPRRNRTASEVAAPIYTKTSDENYDWTWSSNSDPRILRQRSGSRKNDLYRKSFAIERKAFDMPNSLAVQMPLDIAPAATNKSLMGRFKNFRKRAMSFAAGSEWSGDDPEAARDQYTVPAERTTQLSTFLNTTASRRPSNFTSALPGKDADVLETTTIADLIRALEVIHTKAVTSDPGTPPTKHKFEPSTPPKIPSLLTLFPRNMISDNNDSITSHHSDRRRGSLRPTLYHRPMRRQSEAMMRPPPYNTLDSPLPMNRRFSVRPSALNIPPGQAPPISNASSSSSIHNAPVARRISIRPSPLARQHSTQSETGPIPKPSSIWRTAITSRLGTSRHASLTSLTERKKGEGTDSK